MTATMLKSGLAAKASPSDRNHFLEPKYKTVGLGDSVPPRSLPSGLPQIKFAERSFENGEQVAAASDQANFCLCVKSGVIISSRYREGFGREVLGFHFAGDLVGPVQLQQCWGYDMEARGFLRAEFYDLSPRRDFIPSELKTLVELLESAYGASVAATLRERELRSLCVDGRLANFLIFLSGRLGKKCEQGWEMILPMTRAEIASYLALRTETVSRIMARWRRQGLLELEGRSRVVIQDRPALAAMIWDSNVNNPL